MWFKKEERQPTIEDIRNYLSFECHISKECLLSCVQSRSLMADIIRKDDYNREDIFRIMTSISRWDEQDLLDKHVFKEGEYGWAADDCAGTMGKRVYADNLTILNMIKNKVKEHDSSTKAIRRKTS